MSIEPLGYEPLSGGYKIKTPVRKYVVLAEQGEWTLEGSTKLQNQPVNSWEYGTGTEIKRDSGMLFAGYATSLATFACLFFALKTAP